MNCLSGFRCRNTFLAFLVLTAAAAAQTAGVGHIRHAPAINAGSVEGSLQQMLPESVTLNGGVNISGDLLVPGTPKVRLNGNPSYGGTLDGSGAATPSNYQVTLNGNSRLSHIVRRADAVPLPTVAAPALPAGTRVVVISSPGQSPGDFATVRHLTLNGNVGQFTIPPGTYGDFTANGGSGFTLGVAGATHPAVYNFQHLALNGQTQVQLLGPVVITVANGFSANGTLGTTATPSRLTLNVYSGGLTLNGGCNVYGYVNAPSGTVIVNGGSQLVGGVTCDRLIVNGGGLLRLQAAASANHPPVANDIAVALNEDTPAAFTLAASDPDGNALTFSVLTSPGHGTLGGTAPNLTYVPGANFNGADAFTFKASDGSADSNPATVNLTISPVNDRPTAEAKTLTVAEDGSANAILSGFDLDGDALTFAVSAPPAHGTLSGTAPNLVYSPAPDFNGADSFAYTAADAALTSEPAVFSITVTPVNDAPVANGNTYAVNEDSPLAITLTGSDPDGDALSYGIVTPLQHGTLSGTAPNLTYQPQANFSGTDGFTFRTFDGTVYSGSATVLIQVTNQNDPPVANN
jgi:hypothetical protein